MRTLTKILPYAVILVIWGVLGFFAAAAAFTLVPGMIESLPIHLAFVILATASIIACQISSSLNASDIPYLRSIVPPALHSLTASALEVAYAFNMIGSNFYLPATIAISLSLVYVTLRFSLFNGQLPPNTAKKIAFLTSGTLALIFGIIFLYPMLYKSIPIIAYLNLTRFALAGFFAPMIALFITYQSHVANDFMESMYRVKTIFTRNDENAVGLTLFYGVTLLSLLMFIIGAYAMFSGGTGISRIVLYNFCPEFLLAGIVFFGRYRILNQHDIDQSYISTSTALSFKRFVSRVGASHRQASWATTMGMRTANFIIDHDPINQIPQHLTTTVGQIRKDEIQRHIEKVIAPFLLSINTIDNKLYGTIDPEKSTRSCVEVLRFFAAIYMDVIPLVERRLKTLASLLPIIDPHLARIVTPAAISQSLSKMAWTFYMEFGWVDQCMVKGMGHVNYLLYNEQLNLTGKNSIAQFLQQKNRVGNFIWIGSEARKRLIMEAGQLASTIESISLPTINNFMKNSDEHFVHLIKFEKIIPHLQKYFNLEETRQILRDHDERFETKRFLNILEMKLTKSSTIEEGLGLLESMKNYDFIGFKEKDFALNFVLDIAGKLRTLSPSHDISEHVRQKLYETISVIGYPSQFLHDAYLRKHSLRNAVTLADCCLNISGENFYESWLLLASLDPTKYEKGQINLLLEVIDTAITSTKFAQKKLIQRKALEALINLASGSLDQTQRQKVVAIIHKIPKFLSWSRAATEQLAFFLDALLYLEHHAGITVTLSDEEYKIIVDYFERLKGRLGFDSSRLFMVEARLSALKQAAGDTKDAAS
jgi:hypothetical protein